MLLMWDFFGRLPLHLTLLALVLAGCSRPPELIGIDNPEIPVAAVPEANRHRIFVTTTREASNELGTFLSTGRAATLGLAAVNVSVPPAP